LNRFKQSIIVAGLVLGIAASVLSVFGVRPAEAVRNGTGTYSLPAGNPVTAGSTISTTWANTTLNDIASELTNSLDRNGSGGMLAQLKLHDGTSASPGAQFSSEGGSGLYRAATNDVRMQVGGLFTQKWSVDGGYFPIGAWAVGNNATSNNNGGPGLLGTGGLLSGTGKPGMGVKGIGAIDGGVGVIGLGAGGIDTHILATGVGGYFGGSLSIDTSAPGGTDISNSGVYAIGGPHITGNGGVFVGGSAPTGAGRGVLAYGGTPTSGNNNGAAGGTFIGGLASGSGAGGVGVSAQGGLASTAVGGYFASGTAATATVSQDAIEAANGALKLSGTNPNSDVAFTNRLTGKSTVKSWGKVSTNGAGSVSVSDGFNITSVSVSATATTVTMASAMSSTNYIAVATLQAATAYVCNTAISSTTVFTIICFNTSSGAIVNPSTTAILFGFIAMGAQ
jgi:hypothetical protein